MTTTFEVDVLVSPTLLRPPAFEPFLVAGMTAAVRRVQAAGEASIAARTRAGGGARWQSRRPSAQNRSVGAKGYGPLGGSLVTHAQASTVHDGAVGYVSTPVFYSRFLEFGTKAHPITATHQRAGGRPGMLAFAGRAPVSAPGALGPFLTFRRRVQAKAIPARHLLRDAAEGERDPVTALFLEQTRAWTAAWAAPAAPRPV